jgi:hypothetical protein
LTTVVLLPDLDPDVRALWTALADLANRELEGRTDWCLVGGLMVQLFAFEHDAVVRPTADIDLLGDARARPSGTEQLARGLARLGATVRTPSADGTACQFDLGGQLIEVLGPEGLGDSDPRTLGQSTTVQIPGGTQALRRAEEVILVLGPQQRVRLRRPTLAGALLIKARSLPKHHRPDDQREDLVLLLSLVTDARELKADMSTAERRWLRKIKALLNLDDPSLAPRFSGETLTRARQAYELLIR